MSATAFQRMRREAETKKLARAAEEQQEPRVLTNKEIKALLDEKGIEYDARANKETLLKLLEGAE
ncbi:MAG: HeH/LEM domain [Herbinix sp.]|jgi:transposase|nr:HeH/LEM domain [Herbinix sp.]